VSTAENQQTVEAALWRCPNWPHPETIACVYCVQTEDARAALRDLAAQAELAAGVVKAARVMADEAGGRMEGQAWLDLRDALARLDGAR